MKNWVHSRDFIVTLYIRLGSVRAQLALSGGFECARWCTQPGGDGCTRGAAKLHERQERRRALNVHSARVYVCKNAVYILNPSHAACLFPEALVPGWAVVCVLRVEPSEINGRRHFYLHITYQSVLGQRETQMIETQRERPLRKQFWYIPLYYLFDHNYFTVI